MTQEKLEQRAGIFWREWKGLRDMNVMFAEFARAELQKAAEIVQSYGGLQSNMVAEKIRKLME